MVPSNVNMIDGNQYETLREILDSGKLYRKTMIPQIQVSNAKGDCHVCQQAETTPTVVEIKGAGKDRKSLKAS